MNGSPTLIVYADYVSPYSWLAEVALRRLRQEGVALGRRAFELRPAGTPLPGPDAPWPRDDWDRGVVPLAQELGLELRYPPLVTRTRKAHEAAAHARGEGFGEELHEAIFRAYWEDGRDIGRIDVLVEIGAAAGLDRGGLRVALDIDQRTEQVIDEMAGAAELGIRNVPAFVLERGAGPGGAAGEGPARGEIRSGVQRYEELRSWVTRE